MKTSIIIKTEDYLKIRWEDEKEGFGELIIKWNGKEFIIDSEYMGIDFVIKILKNLE